MPLSAEQLGVVRNAFGALMLGFQYVMLLATLDKRAPPPGSSDDQTSELAKDAPNIQTTGDDERAPLLPPRASTPLNAPKRDSVDLYFGSSARTGARLPRAHHSASDLLASYPGGLAGRRFEATQEPFDAPSRPRPPSTDTDAGNWLEVPSRKRSASSPVKPGRLHRRH